MTQKTIIWIAALIFISALCYIVYFSKDPVDDNFIKPPNTDSLKFNSDEWKKHKDDYETIRPYVLGDLMRNVLRQGQDSTEVKDLIGQPYWNERKIFYYKIGIFEGMEPTYLVIEFDENGKLSKKYLRDI